MVQLWLRGHNSYRDTEKGHSMSFLGARYFSCLPHLAGCRRKKNPEHEGEKQQSCARAVRALQRHKLGKERVT